MALTFNQQKIAERLKILLDHTTGITARVYNIKKQCGDSKSKPSFLAERTLEGAVKMIVKKFPAIDLRGGGASMQHVAALKGDILKNLQLYYFTFVDLLELRDNVNEFLTTLDACQITLDVTVNTDLAVNYLDLVTAHVCLMILLSKVDDRKAMLGLYTAAYEMTHGNAEPHFPRLGQMIMDYENPLKKLAEEFIPHQTVLRSALASLRPVYIRRNLSADDLRKNQFLSLTLTASQILLPTQTETVPCEYLSIDRMDRWIIFGILICQPMAPANKHAGQDAFDDLWNMALHSSLVTQLYRDEVMYTHSDIQHFFEGMKGYSKKVSELKEAYNIASQHAPTIHRERRKFLRNTLKELVLLLQDQPGLLGPKILFVWIGLSFARDEITWLIRHTDCLPHHTNKKQTDREDQFLLPDRNIAELMFYMVELRRLVERYTQVIQRCYVQFLSGYDAYVLSDIIQGIHSCPEEESVILSASAASGHPTLLRPVPLWLRRLCSLGHHPGYSLLP